MAERSELLQGTLDLLLLKILSLEPMHGWGITMRMEQMSNNVLFLNQGSLYPALERLQRNGWVTSKWGKSPTGRRARYYAITASGRKRLGQEISEFDRVGVAIARILGRTT